MYVFVCVLERIWWLGLFLTLRLVLELVLFVPENDQKKILIHTTVMLYTPELKLPTKMQRFGVVRIGLSGTLLSRTGQFLTFCHHSFPLITHSNTIPFLFLLLNSVFFLQFMYNILILFFVSVLQIAYRRRRHRRRSLPVFKLSVLEFAHESCLCFVRRIKRRRPTQMPLYVNKW